ncbi:GntR family transcriptional regulator [Phenylobacterium sp. CCH9-H3]|uniref:GntR family transcriptional regulator n=1 Tax=Phenylobacterium sp. CCH9-H3 TaxID=1768774 RepID=UPI00083B4E93|nr:GntR family transcriptional regulator [Phenylobacterium sp. CCH9-H3]
MSRTLSALLKLRDLILSGELAPGQRLQELAVVDRLNVSRTPVRAALARLQEEGLVEAVPSGGYAVRAFSEEEVDEAIELRGVLEGLAARLAAEKGAAPERLAPLKACLAEIDAVLGATRLSEADFERYVELNERFHARLTALADSPMVAQQIARAYALPFASPSGFVMAQAAQPQARHILAVAQDQHRCVLEAVERREGARAEAIMREHARLARRNLELAMRDQAALRQVRGAALIAPRRA